MTGGSITGTTADNGGGVFSNSFGTFKMAGGTISGNTAEKGGGVFNKLNPTFTLTGGTITGNSSVTDNYDITVEAYEQVLRSG